MRTFLLANSFPRSAPSQMKHFTIWGLAVSCFLCHFCHLSSLEACKNPLCGWRLSLDLPHLFLSHYGPFLLNSTGCLHSHGRCEVLHPCCCNSCSAHGYKPSI
ncbi:hypothetical protein AMTRI_Chr02g254380 [Amborella trichopoda]